MQLLQLLLYQRGRLLSQGFGEEIAFRDLAIYLVAMVEVVSQSGVDVTEGQVVFNRYLIGAHPHLLMPDRDVMDGDAVPGDARLASGYARCYFDVPVEYLHDHKPYTPQ